MLGQLSVSGPRVSHDCGDVAAVLRRLGIHGDVTRNLTILDGKVEAGCRVRVVSPPVRDNTQLLWAHLQRELGLRCAHVKFELAEAGCVYDVYRPSACPGSETEPNKSHGTRC